jgi:hypothetical protein
MSNFDKLCDKLENLEDCYDDMECDSDNVDDKFVLREQIRVLREKVEKKKSVLGKRKRENEMNVSEKEMREWKELFEWVNK